VAERTGAIKAVSDLIKDIVNPFGPMPMEAGHIKKVCAYSVVARGKRLFNLTSISE
jgi:hypothetical protein